MFAKCKKLRPSLGIRIGSWILHQKRWQKADAITLTDGLYGRLYSGERIPMQVSEQVIH
jgi:hypothetical protein